MTIAVPTLELALPLTLNLEAVCAEQGISVRHASIEQCGELLFANMVDAALVSPLGYGMGVGRVDYRIAAGPCLALQDYTNVFGATFSEGSSELSTFSSDEPDSFMCLMMRLAMSEKFDIDLSPVATGSVADCVIGPTRAGHAHALDLGEEWFDMAEAPLPLALWVVRVDSEIVNFDDLVGRACQPGLTERPVSEVTPLNSEHAPREGAVLYRWSETIEEGMLAALNTLYFHQRLSEIPAIKINGRD
jgi:hypothetical protein